MTLPLRTAPTDGTRIILYVPIATGEVTAVVGYYGTALAEPDECPREEHWRVDWDGTWLDVVKGWDHLPAQAAHALQDAA